MSQDLAYAKERVAVESPRNGPLVLAELTRLQTLIVKAAPEIEALEAQLLKLVNAKLTPPNSWAPIADELHLLAGRWLAIPRDVYDAIGVIVPALRALEAERVLEAAREAQAAPYRAHEIGETCWCVPILDGSITKHR